MFDELLLAPLWVKALHAGLAILWVGPQLALGLVIQARASLPRPGTPAQAAFAAQAADLVFRWMNYCMLGAFVLGSWLAWRHVRDDGSLPGWLWAKLALVFALASLHGLLFRQFRHACRGRPTWPAPRFVGLQRVGMAMTLGVVALVITKPLFAAG